MNFKRKVNIPESVEITDFGGIHRVNIGTKIHNSMKSKKGQEFSTTIKNKMRRDGHMAHSAKGKHG